MRRRTYLITTGAFVVHALGTQPAPGVLLLEFEERRSFDVPGLWRRAEKTVEEVITNEKQRGGYFSTCTVGTPPQDVVLLLDTGSSDTWVPASNAAICSPNFSLNPCPLGNFNPNSSSTSSKFLAPGSFKLDYLDKNYSEGDYVRDVFGIGDIEVANFTMGLGLNATLSHGVIGVGYAINEASMETAGIQYENLPIALVRNNITATSAYSLWLNDLSSPMGSILFGGVDTEKYVGDMIKVKVIPVRTSGREVYNHFRVPLTSISAESPSGSDSLTTASFPVEVILDSGTTLSSLPQDLVDQMWEEAGAEFSSILRQPLIPCYRRNSPGKFTFGFGGPGGPKVVVPMDELVLDLSTGEPPHFPDSSKYKGQEACLFGIRDFGGPPYILGGTFLRSAYVVYDLANNEIGIAQTDFNETESSIIAFASNGSTIPSATEAPNQGQTDTPAQLILPAYNARDGFQNSAWMPAAFRASALLVLGAAFWTAF